jgi:hypothetical protein
LRQHRRNTHESILGPKPIVAIELCLLWQAFKIDETKVMIALVTTYLRSDCAAMRTTARREKGQVKAR